MILRFFFILIVANNCLGQVKLSFEEIWHEKKQLNFNSDEQINSLKWYLSNVKLFRENDEVFESSESFLIDHLNPEKKSVEIDFNEIFDSISFLIGVDYEHNTNGVFGGDLDPTNGMYWAWHSGYINIKIEGKTVLSSDVKHEFSYHLGGYEEPFESVQEIGFKTTTRDLKFLLELDKFLSSELLNELPRLMLPGKKAQDLSINFGQCILLLKE